MLPEAQLQVFEQGIKKITELDEIWVALNSYMANLGVDALSYYHIAPPGSQDFSEKYFFAAGFDDDKVTEHRRNHSIFSSPFTAHSNPLLEPVFWSQFSKELELSEDEKNRLRGFYCQSAREGIVIPVFGPNSRNGCVVMRFADAKTSFTDRMVHEANLAAYLCHIQFCRIRARVSEPTVKLTAREQEVLTWVARGKSNSVIAEIVGISQHTVNGYLRRVYLKTQTSDRTTAALRAIGDALIDI